jgi:myo-inositol-1(or 4)-monophosphatase
MNEAIHAASAQQAPFGPLRLDHELQIAMQLALEAGALLRDRQRQPLNVSHKANGEIVTPADLASNEIICRGLASAFRHDMICSEEGPVAASVSDGPRTWIIDPLDSTSNYVQGGDEYSLSIGLAIHGEAVLGVVYNPSRHELFAGYRGLGTTWNGVPVRATLAAPPHWPRLLVSSKEWKRGVNSAGACRIEPMASMAYKLARVAAGREDGTLSLKTRKPWGTCAGTALVLASSGSVTSLEGQPLLFDCRGPRTFNGLVAAGCKLHAQVLELASSLKACMPSRHSA